MRTLFILMIAILFPALVFADAPVFRLNSGASEPLSDDRGDAFYNQIAAEIFKRLDMKLAYIRTPPERSLIQVNNGIDDGNIARIKGIEKKWPNLIRVPESIIVWEFTAYSHGDNIQISGWQSLKSYTVGYVRGWQIYDKKAKTAKKIIRASNPAQLFNLLKKGRIDLALFERYQGLYWFNKIGYTPIKLSPSLVKKPLYLYLHEKHKKLVPKMATTILRMKKDGAYQQIFDRVFKNKRKL